MTPRAHAAQSVRHTRQDNSVVQIRAPGTFLDSTLIHNHASGTDALSLHCLPNYYRPLVGCKYEYSCVLLRKLTACTQMSTAGPLGLMSVTIHNRTTRLDTKHCCSQPLCTQAYSSCMTVSPSECAEQRDQALSPVTHNFSLQGLLSCTYCCLTTEQM